MAKADDYARAMRAALERQSSAEGDGLDAVHRVARRLPANVLTISDIAEAVSDQLRDQRREILQHIGRAVELLKIQGRGNAVDARSKNFHRRLCELESEVRELKGKVKR